MYILFNNNEETSCGVFDTIKPFTDGIYVDTVDGLTKEQTKEVQYTQYNAKGEILYLKDNIVTTTVTDTPYTKTKTITFTTDIKHNPELFTKIDIMKFKQQQLLTDKNYDNCMMYEFNLNNFINNEQCVNCNIGINTLTLKSKGSIRTNAIPINGCEQIKINIDSNGTPLWYYSYDGDGFLKGKGNIKNVAHEQNIYLNFKNNSKEDIIIYGYQVLFK